MMDSATTSLSEEHARIIEDLRKHDFNLVDYTLSKDDFEAWVAKAGYEKYPKYYLSGLQTKHLDHYLAALFLDFQPDDVFIDVASALSSPAPDIYHDLYGCTVYRQDLLFPEGINGNTIGGDASQLPLPDGFASKLSLHSSIEHFEGDSDSRFITEASRVLRPGGKMVVVPLFMSSRYLIKTDPECWPKEGMYFEGDAAIIKKDWKNRYARFYDAAHLATRVRDWLADLKMTIYVMTNPSDILPNCDRKFVAVFER
jgi:SAM-dependent methyltransferase